MTREDYLNTAGNRSAAFGAYGGGPPAKKLYGLGAEIADPYYQSLQARAQSNIRDQAYGAGGGGPGLLEQFNARGQTPDSGVFNDALATAMAREQSNAAVQGAQAGMQAGSQLMDQGFQGNQAGLDRAAAGYEAGEGRVLQENQRLSAERESMRGGGIARQKNWLNFIPDTVGALSGR